MPRQSRVPTKKTRATTGTKILSLKTTDQLLKAMLVLSRSVDHLLETQAIEFADQPLSKTKVQILRLLGLRGGKSSTTISRYLGVSKPAVTQVVASLIKSKMVKRVPSGQDRRGFDLVLTETGRTALKRIQAHHRHLTRSAVARSRPDRVDRWIDVLQEVATALAQADRDFTRFCYQCRAHEDGTCVLVGGDADCPYLRQRRGAGSGSRR